MFVVGLPVGCSLSPLTKVPLRIELRRDGPPIAGMNHYALAVSGGTLSNSLTAASVGGRSLGCLNLDGQVLFPYSYAQLKQGVSLSLVPGQYRITFFGFGGPATPGVTSVGAMYSAAPLVETYVLAQKTVSVAGGESIKLDATYEPASSANRNLVCVPQTGTLYALVADSGSPVVYDRENGAWSANPVTTGGGPPVNTSLFVEGSGNLLVAQGILGVGIGMSLFTPAYQSIAGAAQVSSNYNVATTVTSDGIRHVMGARDSAGDEMIVNYFSSNGTTWNQGTSAFPAEPEYRHFSVTSGPFNRLLTAAVRFDLVGYLVVNQGTSGLGWGSHAEFDSAGAQNCLVGNGAASPAVSFDSVGAGHVVFLCGPDAVGIATNRSGPWVSSIVWSNAGLLNDVDMTIVDGVRHIVMAHAGGVSYLSASEAASTFATPLLIYDNPPSNNTLDVGIVGADASHLHVAFLEEVGGTLTRLRYLENSSGSWVVETAAELGLSARLFPPIYIR